MTGWLLAALCALPLGQGAGADDPTLERAVAREWEARASALAEPTGAAGDATAARTLVDDDWRVRAAVLEAAARTPRAARGLVCASAGEVSAALDDAHPNVRAGAVLVLAVAGVRPPDVDDARLARLARDPFAGVRRGLLELCARRPTHLDVAARRALLSTLADDAGGVGAVARDLLLQEGPGAAELVARTLARDGDPDSVDKVKLVHALPLLWSAPVDPELVRVLRERAHGGTARALVECLALHGEHDGADVRAERSFLANAVCWPAPSDEDEPFLREHWRGLLRELADEGDEAFGRGLLALLDGQDAEDPDWDAVALDALDLAAECAALALPPTVAVELARDLSDAWGGLVWLNLSERTRAFDPVALAAWIAPERGEELRYAVAATLADVYRQSGDEGAEALLFGLARDRDSTLRQAAFRWLCDGPRVEEIQGRLHACWSERDADERALDLRALPRGRPLPAFQGDLLRLCADPEERHAEVIELLAGLRAEPAVLAALRAWSREALDGLALAADRGEDGAPDYGVHESRAVALAKALGAEAVPEQERAALVALEHPPLRPEEAELPKTCLALLGASAPGRARLPRFLGAEIERRARIEAAIQLTRPTSEHPSSEPADPADDDAHARAARVLAEDLAACDEELGARVVTALSACDDAGSAALLARVAQDPRAALGWRLAACAGLARPGGEPALEAVVRAEGESEVGRAAVAALARAGTGDARAMLRALWDPPVHPGLRGDLLVALARVDGLESVGVEALLARPLDDARAGLVSAWHGRARGSATFRWDSELTASRHLAARGTLARAFEVQPAWPRLESRLLGELARVAQDGGEAALARRLTLAARTAGIGEGLASDEALDVRFAWEGQLLDLALEAGDLAGALDWATELGASFRLERPRSGVVAQQLGRFDRRAGIDPAARLDVLPDQLRARALLPEDRARARELLRGTRARVLASRAAAALQSELERRAGDE